MYSIHERGAQVIYTDAVEKVEIAALRRRCLGLAGIKEPPPVAWPESVQSAFASPLGAAPLHLLGRGARRVALIVSDSTRGVPTARVIPFLLQELDSAGVRRSDITVIIASGVHRPATADEILEIVGAENLTDLKVVSHDPYDEAQLITVGKTSFGTSVALNKSACLSDLRIAIGKVEPHEFAGFSGGRKSVLPGIAGEKTIAFNHRPDMLLAAAARPGQLKGNPIHLDMMEAAEMVKIGFMVNLVLNQSGAIIGLFAGDPAASFLAAVDHLTRFCAIALQARPDIIVTTPGQPLNINFYQSIKPLIALAPVIERGGVLVLYGACRDGIGSEDMLIPFEGAKDIAALMDRLKTGYRIQMDHALLLGKILQQGIRIVVATPSVDPAILQKMFMTPAADPQQALDQALQMVERPDPKILFFPQAQRTLPVLNR